MPGKVFLTSLLLLFCTWAQAQEKAVIYGTVRDSSNNLIPSANVAIIAERISVEADENGKYEIKVTAGKEHEIRFSFVGRNDLYIKVKALSPGQRYKADVMMGRDQVTAQVVEIEELKREKISSITINSKALKKIPNISGNFETILRTLGASGGSELSSAYNVRGGNYDENLVYVNDVEIYRPQLVRTGQQEGLSFINPDLVENVRFSTGGFEAKYGDKLSSVLDVKYRNPKKFAAGASLNLMGGSVYVEGRTTRFTYLIGSRLRSNRYVLNSLDVQGNYLPLFADVQGLLTYNFSERTKLSYLGNFAMNRYLLVPQSQQTSFGTVTNALQLTIFFDGQELMRYQTYMNSLTLEHRKGKYTNLKLIASHFNTSENELFTTEGAYRLDQLDNELGSDKFAQAKFNRGTGYFINNARNYLNAQVFNIGHKGSYIDSNHTLYWGVQYQHEIIDDHLKEWYYVDSAGYSVPFNSGDSLFLNSYIYGNASLQSSRYSAYIQNTTKLDDSSNMQLTYGLRTNYWDLNRQNVVSPRLQFSFEPNRRYNQRLRDERKRTNMADSTYDFKKKRDWVLKFAFGYYYQPPFYRELRDLQGNVHTDVKAQRSIHFVFGGDMYFKAWGRIFKYYSEVYYKKLDNLVPYQIENVRIRYYAQNSSHGYAYGWDNRVNGEFIKDLESWFSMSILSIRENITYHDSLGTHQSGFIRRPTDQRVNFGLFFQDEFDRWPRWKMYLNMVYGSNVPFYLGGASRFEKTNFKIPAYRRIDIGFSRDIITEDDIRNTRFKKIFKRMFASAEIFNLTQANNTISFIWVRDVDGNTYGVPNYLTSRRLNIKVVMEF